MLRLRRISSAAVIIQISCYLLITGMAGPFTIASSTGAFVQPLTSAQAVGSECSVSSSNQTSTETSTTSTTVPVTVPSIARSKSLPYIGSLATSFVLRLELVFKIRNSDQFVKCLSAISDPTSPEFRQFLNATTLAPFIETPSQETAAINFLQSQGFTVTPGPSPLVLNLVGTTAVVQNALQVHMKLFRDETGHVFYTADTDPTLPQQFATGVGTLSGLDNYTTIKPVDVPGSCSLSYCAQAVEVGYSMSALYSNGLNGHGVTVAVVDAAGDPNAALALHQYDLQYGLPDPAFQVLCPSGTNWGSCGSISYDPGWASESAMDIEAVHAMAPGAAIDLFYVSPTAPLDAIDYIASSRIAQVVSNSWTFVCGSSCSDVQLGSSFVDGVNARLALDAAQGLTILFASGDQGSTPDGSNPGTEFPASDPYVLAVGATNLYLTGCVAATCAGYDHETGAPISGGGYSGYFTEPSWQTSSIGIKPGRGVPDVSMLGWIPGFYVYSTASDKCGMGGDSAGWFSCAGTSLSTPLWAGFLAVIVQIDGGMSFGNIDQLIYQIASSDRYSADFHDITSGSNGLSAGIGWDPVTGWGTPIGSNFAQDVPHQKLILSNSGGVSLDQGDTGSTMIDVTLGSPPRLVTLACSSGLPPWALCSFSPSSGLGSYTSALAVSTEPSTPAGTYNITVSATTGLISNSTSLALTVNQHQQSCKGTTIPSVDNCPLSFVQGWNLVSLPIVPVANSTFPNTVTGMFGSNTTFGFMGSVTSVFTYVSGVWQFCTVSLQGSGVNAQYVCTGSLSNLVDGRAYWVFAKQAFTLNNANNKRPSWGGLLGSVIPVASSPPGYTLNLGWNLIGYKPQPNVTATEGVASYLRSINGDYDASNVWIYDNSNQSWIRADPSYLLHPGQGVWILMITPATLRP